MRKTMTVSIDGNPGLTLRCWAKAYRENPQHRFPSDPDAEFLPRDLDAAADEIERLRAALEQISEVCESNAPASCNQAMALAFVRQVANAALAAALTKGKGT
jgi:hypothetical protein